MAYKIKLTYLDGSTVDVFPSPRARIETERHFGGLSPANQQEATFYIAWAHLKKTGDVTADFDPWVDSLADIDEERVAEPRPTPPAPSAESSSS